MLRWTFNDRKLRSPLILVPVALDAAGGGGGGKTFRLSIDEAEESTPNYYLLEKLRLSFGLEIPGLANPARDDAGTDLPAAFSATRRALAAARLPFEDRTTPARRRSITLGRQGYGWRADTMWEQSVSRECPREPTGYTEG